MLPFKLVYDDAYDLHLASHVFPSQKYRLIYQRLLEEGYATTQNVLHPAPATDEDILRVHTAEYLEKLKAGTFSPEEIARMEIPYTREMAEACWLAAGGSILAARQAMTNGWAANIGGGFHHACPGHGEGFCLIHDVAVAIRRLQADRAIERAMVVDTDAHQGNGTAMIFRGDENVFTLSIHQENNYPFPKVRSTMDIPLEDGTGDEDYLAILEKHLQKAFEHFAPQIVFYVAGADPYREDQLGGLALSIEGLKKRDTLVYGYARREGSPVVITLAGGYARRVTDTVHIQVNTILAAGDEALRQAGKARR